MKLKCEAFQGDFARCFVLAQDNHCHCAVGDHILTIGANVFIGCEFDCTGIWEKELLKITTYEVILPSSLKIFFCPLMVLLPRQLNSYIRSFETTQLKFWMKTQTFSKLFLEFHQKYWIKSKHLISRGDITSTYHENLQNINFRNLLWNKYSRNIAAKH